MSSTSSSGTVLVVDDDAAVRRVVELVLRRGGYDVMEAVDGEAAIALVRQHANEISIVLLDVMMPRMTGKEAFPGIRDEAPDMPVIFFSGYDRNEVAEHLDEQLAFTSFLPKPFDNRQLLTLISEGIESRRSPGTDE